MLLDAKNLQASGILPRPISGKIPLDSFGITGRESTVTPEKTVEISNELIKRNVGNIVIDYAYINSVLLFAFMWITTMYYQINFAIEKHWIYIHKIETTLTKDLVPFEICREGKNYLEPYPWLLTIVDKVYKVIFPLSLITIALMKLISETSINKSGYVRAADIFILSIVIFISVLYLSYTWFKDFEKLKQKYRRKNRI